MKERSKLIGLGHENELITMNGVQHPQGDVNRLNVPRTKGGLGLISWENCIGSWHETTFGWYLENSEELLIVEKSVSTVET